MDAETLKLYKAAAAGILAEMEPPDRLMQGRESLWRCLECGETFADDRDFIEHNAEVDE